ncbi:hypothetical protein [Kiloniella majae]|uniref:hypothetical protein n=1 Tax=Kiloniella majae TaxID=1938558 RepID=UPI000A2775CD|nr:hypothetical protein [Kiloniella majae]
MSIQEALGKALNQASELGAKSAANKIAQNQAGFCPKAEAIIMNNGPLVGQNEAFNLSASKFKRLSAELIIGVRRNREACKQMGRNHRGADARILAKAARLRDMAFKLTTVESRKERSGISNWYDGLVMEQAYKVAAE